MKILKLKLRGAIGIRKGLGVDEVEIDFSNFQSGLIALTGRNGSGKTTIMENLHPYRQMVSRDGSLQSHFYLKDSHRILEFEFNGLFYESRILVDALTGGSEAYLIHIAEPSDIPLNDGKLTTYDKAIEDLLGSPELFFNSVFSGQKSKGIAELKPADRRKLFYELLNLNSYEVYLEQSKEYLKSGENKLAKIEGEISALQQDQTSVDILEEERKDKLEYQAQLIDEISEIETSIEGANEVIRSTEVKVQIAHEKELSNQVILKELNAVETQINSITKQNNDKIARYQGDIVDQNKLIERYKKLATPESKLKIETALSGKKELETKINELKESRSNLDKLYSTNQKNYSESLKKITELEKEVNELRTNYTGSQSKQIQALSKYDAAKRNADAIQNSGCDSPTDGGACVYLKTAHEMKTELPSLKSQVDQLAIEVKGIGSNLFDKEKILIDERTKVDEAFQQKEKELSEVIEQNNTDISFHELKLSELNAHNWDKLLEEQRNAENEIKLIEQNIAGTEKLIAEAKISFDNALTHLKKQADDLNHRYDNTVADRIEEMNLDLSAAKQKLIGLNQQLQSSRARIDEAKQDVAKLEQLIETMTKNEERIEKLKESKIGIESEIKDWTFLVKAFDKTGIPVLKLENSGIEITSVANDLLSIFENKFRIVFETTKLKADKKSYKESFDINIVEEDGVCEISNKSGGERVWIETALQLAISLVVRQQGKKIETSFLDEKDGQLDADNANLYLAMLRNAHNKSGIHNTFIITHRNELIDLIPQRVSLNDGYIQIINN